MAKKPVYTKNTENKNIRYYLGSRHSPT